MDCRKPPSTRFLQQLDYRRGSERLENAYARAISIHWDLEAKGRIIF